MAVLDAPTTPAADPSAADRPVVPSDGPLDAWVEAVAALTEASRVVWCNGTMAEVHRLNDVLVTQGTAVRLDPAVHHDSYLVRSSEDDVARVEDRTYICSRDEAGAGPTNNWRDPAAMKDELTGLFAGCMRGRVMYVVPFSMGPVGGPASRLGVEITDSPYVVVSMRRMTRIGAAPRALIEAGLPWVRALHSVGAPLVDEAGVTHDDVPWPSNETKHIAHFPDTKEIWSYGSGYGGNALLGKKCFALRIASVIGREEGWLAEHMLLIRLISPSGRDYHLAAAFPSACGKTNMAMMTPSLPGWRVETIGDDITWMRPGPDGRLWAINPEAGLFGVAPGTGPGTNPKLVDALWGRVVYTNVALTDDGDTWWEGKTSSPPEHLIDWHGNDWTPADGAAGRPAAHPNARFTLPMTNCPTAAPDWDDPEGVPLDAIIVGGRRASTVPLVAEARDWEHGVFMGATVGSEQTAAAAGAEVGVLRRDPFAMLPFCGYDMGEHWAHWLAVGEGLGEGAPAMYSVNWFRKGDDGAYLWPGFGDNSRVLAWVAARLDGEVDAVDSPAGLLPDPADLDTSGMDLPDGALEQLLAIDPEAWATEADGAEEFFARFGPTLPPAMTEQLADLRARLHGSPR